MSKSQKLKDEVGPELLEAPGLALLVRQGMTAQSELKAKNRIIAVLLLVIVGLAIALNVTSRNEPVIKLLGETNDGRIRPLPLLNEPLYSHEEILNWAQQCVRKVYKLSYVDGALRCKTIPTALAMTLVRVLSIRSRNSACLRI